MACTSHRAKDKIKKTARKILSECTGSMPVSIKGVGPNMKKIIRVVEADDGTIDSDVVNRSSGLVKWIAQGMENPKRWYRPGNQDV